MLIRLLAFTALIVFSVPSPAGTGLNIIFAVDQSGSMTGALDPATRIKFANDAANNRIQAIKDMILRLADKVEGTAAIYRVSVVEFGGDVKIKKTWKLCCDVEVAVSNCELVYTPGLAGGARSEAQRCISNFHSRWMNNTNTPKALEVVFDEFEKMENAGRAAGEDQARKLVLITDGRPDIIGQTLDELRRKIIGMDAKITGSAVDFWVIGLNDASTYWNTTVDGMTDGQFWSDRTGTYSDETGHAWSKAAEAQDSSVINQRIETILDNWLREEQVKLPCGETPTESVDIRAYYKQITFEATFGAPGAVVEIIHDGALAARLDPDRPRALVATARLDNPKPKTYRFAVKPAGQFYCVAFTVVRPGVKLLPPGDGVARRDEKTTLSFQVQMAAGQHLSRLNGWPLEGPNAVVNPEVAITSPSGAKSSIAASYQENGIYSIEWTPAEEGEHKFGFQGEVRVKTDKGWESDPFIEAVSAENSGALIVDSARTVLWLHLEEPQAEDDLKVGLLPLFSDSIPIRLSLKEAAQPVTLEGYVMGDHNDWLRLEVVDRASGKALPTVKPLPMTLTEGALEARVPLESLDYGPWNGGLWLFPGELNLRVQARDGRVSEQYNLVGIELPGSLNAQRVGGDPMSVAGIQVRYAWWVLALGIILVVLALLLGAWWIVMVLLPKLTIQQEDNKRGGNVRLLIYDCVQDVDAAAPKLSFHISGQPKITLDGRISLNNENESKVAEIFRLKRTPNTGQPVANITYRWRGDDRNQTLNLSGEFPKALWDDYYIRIKT